MRRQRGEAARRVRAEVLVVGGLAMVRRQRRLLLRRLRTRFVAGRRRGRSRRTRGQRSERAQVNRRT